MSSDDRNYESLSAIMDGEANELELHRVLKHLHDNEETRAKAFRYQLVGEVMRKETHDFSQVDLSAAISTAIDAEPMHEHNQSANESTAYDQVGFGGSVTIAHGWTRWLRPAGGAAVAATVTLAVLLGANLVNRSANEGLEAELTAQASNTATNTMPATTAAPQVVRESPMVTGQGAPMLAGYSDQPTYRVPLRVDQQEAALRAKQLAEMASQARFQSYMLQHAEYSALSANQGILPFARVHEFETK
ncbi:sigma-E factor negative regulatory protein [Zooshikella sp. RANM57]|uniref:sigma-E factor negative regulatory protein n=1 Tax=Zooshikella sp. RANM57 TaxID=3425863 RepID=UPI003D6EC4D5